MINKTHARVARVIRESRAQYPNFFNGAPANPFDTIACRFADEFEKHNERFSRRQFLRSCEGENDGTV